MKIMKLAVRSTGAHWRRAHSVLAVAATAFATPTQRAPVVFHVSLGQASATSVSGRLLVFAKPLGPADKRPVAAVNMDQIDTRAIAIAAQEVARLEPGATVDFDADVTAFPTPFSQLKPGRYAVQAVLDRDHSYNYTGRGPGDLVSGVVEMDLPGDAAQALTLATVIPESDPLQPLSNVPAALKEIYAAAKADINPITFASPALSGFWGRPTTLRGWVVTPPDYAAHPGRRYPTVYYTQGFGGSLRSLHDAAVARWDEMKTGKAPPMIWVGIDQSSPSGTSEFVNSVNNGPWGQALTVELIPELERRYRMDAKPSGRLLTGHSSGGWAALWLQVKYPNESLVVMADKAQLSMAFLNIITNSIEAMEEKEGRLIISVQAHENNCEVRITDNGCGISEENQKKLFEPYFTNKRNGVGLGLSATLNVLQSHHSKIDVISIPGTGTTFCVTIPIKNKSLNNKIPKIER